MKEIGTSSAGSSPVAPQGVDYQENADITELHAEVVRSESGAAAGEVRLPVWSLLLCAAVLILAGVYLGTFSGGFKGDVLDETAGFRGMPADTGSGAEKPALTLAEQGKTVFSLNCATCHQATGTGVPGSFPPLAGSEWVTGNPKRLIAILLKGIQGELTVKGAKYNGAMPGWETQLSDQKIAAVASYIRSSWGNQASEISVEEVAAARTEFAARKEPWTQADLEKIPDAETAK